MKKLFLLGFLSLFLATGASAQKIEEKSSSDFIEIKDDKQFNDIVKNGEMVLVDFYATWCGPCKTMPPVLSKIKADYKNIKILKVDVDNNETLSRLYNIRAIPTILLFKKGKLVWNHTGAIGYDKLKLEISKH